MASFMGKGRKPKFELHLKIYDLNNVPLVSGNSFIKWHLSHSMHAEHRGRTSKCPIANHRVDYGFSKIVPSVRMSIDKNGHLTECPLEFEVVQEFAVAEKITLGSVKLNLAEYVEESESFAKDVASPPRKRSSSVGLSPTSANAQAAAAAAVERHADEGIVRRYLMQDSKVNSTLKIGILMVQLDGERNFIAPPLKTAPVFGGIAGFMAPEQVEDDKGPIPSISKPRDASEVQDLYRRTLVASWSRQPSELTADECIEDIFGGGNGWKTGANTSVANLDTDEDDADVNHGTLRPSDFRRLGPHHGHHARSHSGGSGNGHRGGHRRTHSAASDRSVSTVTGGGGNSHRGTPRLGRDDSRESREDELDRGRSDSLTSLAPTLSSGRGESGLKQAREVLEAEAREDLVAWRLPTGAAA